MLTFAPLPGLARAPHHHPTVYPTMDDILVAQFERVEKALGTLVDSIAAYNPSPQAALDLVAADDELSQGLDKRTLTFPKMPLFSSSG